MIINTSYLLSIDPSIKNTAFCLWEKFECCNKSSLTKCKNYWTPILITEYNFKKYDYKEFFISLLLDKLIMFPFKKIIDNTWYCNYNNLSLCIEKGFINLGRGKETLEHLRGFIAGQFNKLITKDMLVHNLTWKKWYKVYFLCQNKNWNKDFSITIANNLIKANNWNIKVENHDQAEALLIGWYYINVEPTVKGKCK